jgi:hypothetical protein
MVNSIIGERVAIESREPIAGAEPQKAARVLDDTLDGVSRQSVHGSVGPNRQLRCRRCDRYRHPGDPQAPATVRCNLLHVPSRFSRIVRHGGAAKTGAPCFMPPLDPFPTVPPRPRHSPYKNNNDHGSKGKQLEQDIQPQPGDHLTKRGPTPNRSAPGTCPLIEKDSYRKCAGGRMVRSNGMVGPERFG